MTPGEILTPAALLPGRGCVGDLGLWLVSARVVRARIDLSAYGLQAHPLRLEIPGGGPQTVGEILDPFASEDPDREALVGRSRRYGYGDLDREVNRAAKV